MEVLEQAHEEVVGFPSMRHFLMILAFAALVGGCSGKKARKLITDPIIEREIRRQLSKPEGALTKGDLKKVKELILSGTKLTDEGLKEVTKLTQLERVQLYATKVTAEGVDELQKALPECTIDWP
jgi:repressor of nif and glnA expression